MREAVTVSREEEETRGGERERMAVGTSIGSKEKISLYFGTEPTDIADRLPADKPPLAFILLAGEEEKSAGGWTGGLSIGERWNIPRLCAISVIRGGDVGWRRFLFSLFSSC